uniref:Large ribosomal subunit protein bL36c n=1 Tax=Hypolytrum nemorum TaxID=76453 RepID=A0A288NXS3_9POAL|nr:ribosomal protein L36 [Hypolytrum nemorum]ANP26050.1 ribosomal protein L36 [Hypolytrum nemorum]QIB72684.1 ribosomal protein L36 [Cyperus glomeratus]QIB72775.1 ribosomal protein L36 [Cyperus difformis]
MKIGASVRKICQRCRLVRRRGQLTVICPNLKHKKRQG